MFTFNGTSEETKSLKEKLDTLKKIFLVVIFKLIWEFPLAPKRKLKWIIFLISSKRFQWIFAEESIIKFIKRTYFLFPNFSSSFLFKR